MIKYFLTQYSTRVLPEVCSQIAFHILDLIARPNGQDMIG